MGAKKMEEGDRLELVERLHLEVRDLAARRTRPRLAPRRRRGCRWKSVMAAQSEGDDDSSGRDRCVLRLKAVVGDAEADLEERKRSARAKRMNRERPTDGDDQSRDVRAAGGRAI